MPLRIEDIERFKDYKGKALKLLNDLAAEVPKDLTEEEKDCLRGLIANKLGTFRNHLSNFEVLAYYLWDSREKQDKLFEAVTYSIRKLSGLFSKQSISWPASEDSNSSFASKRSHSSDSDQQSRKYFAGDTTLTESLIVDQLKGVSLEHSIMPEQTKMDYSTSNGREPYYPKVYDKLIGRYKDPMQNKKLKARDIHDIDRLITQFDAQKLSKTDCTAWPLHLKEEVLKSYYVLTYGWKFARLYIQNQEAVELNLPFVPALPSTMVPGKDATKSSYKFKNNRTNTVKRGGKRLVSKKKRP